MHAKIDAAHCALRQSQIFQIFVAIRTSLSASDSRDRTPMSHYVWVATEVRETVHGAAVAPIWSGPVHAALDIDAPGSAPEVGPPELRDSLPHEQHPGSLARKGLVGASAALRAQRFVDMSAPIGAGQLLEMSYSG